MLMRLRQLIMCFSAAFCASSVLLNQLAPSFFQVALGEAAVQAKDQDSGSLHIQVRCGQIIFFVDTVALAAVVAFAIAVAGAADDHFMQNYHYRSDTNGIRCCISHRSLRWIVRLTSILSILPLAFERGIPA